MRGSRFRPLPVLAIVGLLAVAVVFVQRLRTDSYVGPSNPAGSASFLTASSVSDTLLTAHNPIDANADARVGANEPVASKRDPNGPTARDVVREYFGADAEEAIARLEKKGWDLDKLGPPALSWEQARVELATRVLPTENEERGCRELVTGWTAELTDVWLRERFELGDRPITPAEMERVRSIAAEYDDRLGRIADSYCALRRTYVQAAWDAGRLKYRPFTIWSHGPEVAYVKTDGAGGWAYSLVLTYEECPGLRELRDEAASLAHERDQKVRGVLRGG